MASLRPAPARFPPPPPCCKNSVMPRSPTNKGGRERYAITGNCQTYLEETCEAVDAVTASTECGARMAGPMDVRKSMHALKHALPMRGSDLTKAVAKRVAGILDCVASAIGTGVNRD